MNLVILFSKDRPLQLDATLRSLKRHCLDFQNLCIQVIVKASSEASGKAYGHLERDYASDRNVTLIAENNFRQQVLSIVRKFPFVLWLVDDNIFVQDFSLTNCRQLLEANTDAAGYSLRLGKNTSYCYPLDRCQTVPSLHPLGEGVYKFHWVGAEHDFGYPLEVSSSLYRTADMLPLLESISFYNPNSLEAGMSAHASHYSKRLPYLLCPELSITFCVPINKVQATAADNRVGESSFLSPGSLLKLYVAGKRIDVSAFDGFTPNACHEEVIIPFTDGRNGDPTVSVIIPCYNQAHFLADAVVSVVTQTFTDWECLIVNDGSPDNTSAIAGKLVEQHPDRRIVLLEKQNGGLADARNHGIHHARGKYILPLDSDDKLHPEMLQKTVECLDRNPQIAIVYTDLIHFGAVSKHVTAGEYDFQSLRYANQLNYCSLYRREVWEEVGGYNTNMTWGYEDWDFWIGAGENGFVATHLSEPLLFYRVKTESMYTKALEHDAELKAQIVQNHPVLYSEEEREWAKSVLTPQSPLVSVIVPTHNRPDMLREALQSILNQTFRDFEIIVVNDAGQDVSDVVQAFNSPVITYLSHDRNKGLAAARNTGIRAARGKYIAYLDDDDIFYPEHLETLVSYLQQSGEKVAYTDAFRARQCLSGTRYVTHYKDIPYSFDFDDAKILHENFIPVLCFMHEKICLDVCGMFDESFTRLEDWELWVRMSRHFSIHHVKSLTCEFRYRPDGSSMVSGSLNKFLVMTERLYQKHPVDDPLVYRKRKGHLFALRSDSEAQLLALIATADAGTIDHFRSSHQFERLVSEGTSEEVVLSSFYHHLASRNPDPETTQRHLERALQLDPTNHQARLRLCTSIVSQGKNEEALPHLDVLVEANPLDPGLFDLRNQISAVVGQPVKQPPRFEENNRLKVAVYSFDLPEQACSQLRFYGIQGYVPDAIEILWGTFFDSETGNFTIFAEMAAEADVIAIARFFPRKETWHVVERLMAMGKPVVYDVDDLLTDLPESNPFKKQADKSATYIQSVARKATLVTVSTNELMQHMLKWSHHVAILPNLLNQTLWKHPPIAHSEGAVVIGYVGGPTHSDDLKLVEDALVAISERYEDRIKFRFMGCITDKLRRLRNCEYSHTVSNYGTYALRLNQAGIDIALAPLVDSDFNRCKSNIKWLEYSASGCAGVFSDLPPYASSVDQGVTGLLVGNMTEQWYQAVSLLIENADLRKTIASNARRKALSSHTSAVDTKIWLETYGKILKHHVSGHEKIVRNAPISIVIPLYNKVELTQVCLETLLAHTPQDLYELIFVDNNSSDGTRAFLDALPSNIKIIRNTANAGFARACNQGAAAATGKYLLFLNNDIEVLPGWLQPLLETVESDQSIAAVGSKLLFPDGSIQHAGLTIIEDHKSDDLLVPFHKHYRLPSNTKSANIPKSCQALTGACLMVPRERFEAVGGFCEEFWNGYEDVDLCFKLGQQGGKIVYQPASVLVHHESKSGKERFSRNRENIALLHAKWLGKIKPDVFVDEQDRWYSLVDEIEGTPLSTIIIPVYNRLAFTRQCLEALLADPFASRQEIIVVNNGSRDATPAYLQAFDGQIRIVTNEQNLGFAKACNQGVQAATGDYLVFLNNDTVPKPGWLEALVRGAQTDNAAVVGAKLLYPDGTVQHAGVAFGREMGPYHIFNGFRSDDPAVNKKRVMQAVTAACMLVERELFLRLGGFDEEYLNGFEDVDFCLRAKQQGAWILYTPESELIHFESTSPGRKQHDDANLARFRQRWEHELHFDDEEIYRSEGISLVREANGQVFIERNGTP